MAPESNDLNNAANSGSIDPELNVQSGGSIEEDPEKEQEQEDQAAELESTDKEANIVFVGEGEPLTKINDGMESYKLPSIEDQVSVTGEGDDVKTTGKPFFHKNAGAIIQLFPDQYKRFVKKG